MSIWQLTTKKLSVFYRNIQNAARQKPVLAMVLVILCCATVLPFISALALFSLVGMLSLAQYLESKGNFNLLFYSNKFINYSYRYCHCGLCSLC